MFGDFNVEIDENNVKPFCENYVPTNSIKQPVRYKNPPNPKCKDLFLINAPQSFQSTCVLETELFDFHLMTITQVPN